MQRFMLTDELWSKLLLILLKNRIYDKRDLRLTVEGILYRLRVGCPWRDLPYEQFGDWNKIYKRFNDWSQKKKLMTIFKTLSKNPDMEWKFIDGSIVKAHQHSTGARKGEERAIGRSVAGNTSKIHMATDSSGNPIDFEITEGQVHDAVVAPDLVERTPKSEYTVADKGYDAHHIRWIIRECGSIPVIPKKKNSISKNKKYDEDIYRLRHQVENLFARLKHFRGIATRFDKLKRNYEGTVALACAYLWLKL
jgi:transposase